MTYDCPMCGKAEASGDGIHGCGPCEKKAREMDERYNEDEIKSLQFEMDKCKCRTGDEYCPACRSRMIHIHELRGRPDLAESMMNP